MSEEVAKLRAEAEQLRAQATAKDNEANELERAKALLTPLIDRLLFAASARCSCGLGLAYDPHSKGTPGLPFRGPSQWDCSGVLLETADPNQMHQSYPFALYEIKSERQPSANGQTTRPK